MDPHVRNLSFTGAPEGDEDAKWADDPLGGRHSGPSGEAPCEKQGLVFTASEVLVILNDAYACGNRRATLGIVGPDEAKGWGGAIVNIADRFGVRESYVNGPGLVLDVREGI